MQPFQAVFSNLQGFVRRVAQHIAAAGVPVFAYKGESLDELSTCDHHPDIFVDLTNGQDETCDELAKDNVARHYATMYRYFRSHYKLVKLDDFARTFVDHGTFGMLPGEPSAYTQPLYAWFLIPIYWLSAADWQSIGVAQMISLALSSRKWPKAMPGPT